MSFFLCSEKFNFCVLFQNAIERMLIFLHLRIKWFLYELIYIFNTIWSNFHAVIFKNWSFLFVYVQFKIFMIILVIRSHSVRCFTYCGAHLRCNSKVHKYCDIIEVLTKICDSKNIKRIEKKKNELVQLRILKRIKRVQSPHCRILLFECCKNGYTN